MLPRTVFAYLDPGTGSMLVQLWWAGSPPLAVAVKLYWYRILRAAADPQATEPELDQER